MGILTSPQRGTRSVKHPTYPLALGSTENLKFLLPLPIVKTFKREYTVAVVFSCPVLFLHV